MNHIRQIAVEPNSNKIQFRFSISQFLQLFPTYGHLPIYKQIISLKTFESQKYPKFSKNNKVPLERKHQ